jgi:hypothetical protein
MHAQIRDLQTYVEERIPGLLALRVTLTAQDRAVLIGITGKVHQVEYERTLRLEAWRSDEGIRRALDELCDRVAWEVREGWGTWRARR